MEISIGKGKDAITFNIPIAATLAELQIQYTSTLVYSMAVAEIRKKAMECARYYMGKGMPAKDIIHLMENEWHPGVRLRDQKPLTDIQLQGITLLEGLLDD